MMAQAGKWGFGKDWTLKVLLKDPQEKGIAETHGSGQW